MADKAAPKLYTETIQLKLGARPSRSRWGTSRAPLFSNTSDMSFSESLWSREEAGWDVFGGTPNTACGTHALPEIYCMDKSVF
jgi:hypothetical protein